MQILQQVIGMMTKEEVRHYKLFINRTGKTARQDEQLFDYIRQQYPGYDEEKINKKLYASADKNALYRLKNRVLEDIGKSLSVNYHDDTAMNMISHNLLLARLFRQRSQYRIAFYYLNKAEKKAVEKEYTDWLDIIYGDFIQLSHETLEINPEEYIRRRRQNRIKLNKIQEIDTILAALIYRIKTTQNFARQQTGIIDLLQRTINDFARSREVKSSPTLRFKIYDAVSRILLQQQDFPALEKYLLKTYSEFSAQRLFNAGNHDTKLQMLTYLINSLFKNGKYDRSLEYAERLKAAMEEHNRQLYDKYLFYYYNSLVINYSVKDIGRAIGILQEARTDRVIRKLPMYNVFVYLNLAVLYFGQGSYREALKSLVKPLLEDAFSNLDESFRFKLAVFELMIRYELQDHDYLDRRIGRLKKEYRHLLAKPEFKRQRQLTAIIDKMIVSANLKQDKTLEKMAKELIADKNAGVDADIVSYSNWLRKKL